MKILTTFYCLDSRESRITQWAPSDFQEYVCVAPKEEVTSDMDDEQDKSGTRRAVGFKHRG